MARKRETGNYFEAVAWIAQNDEPTLTTNDTYTRHVIADMVSTLLVADIFHRDALEVATDIIKVRNRIAA